MNARIGHPEHRPLGRSIESAITSAHLISGTEVEGGADSAISVGAVTGAVAAAQRQNARLMDVSFAGCDASECLGVTSRAVVVLDQLRSGRWGVGEAAEVWKRLIVGAVALVSVMAGTATTAAAQSSHTVLVSGTGRYVCGEPGGICGEVLSGEFLGTSSLIHGTFTLIIDYRASPFVTGTLTVNDNLGSATYCAPETETAYPPHGGDLTLVFSSFAADPNCFAPPFSGSIVLAIVTPVVAQVIVTGGSLTFSQ